MSYNRLFERCKKIVVYMTILAMIVMAMPVVLFAQQDALQVTMGVERIDANSLELSAESTGGTEVAYQFDMREMGTGEDYTTLREYSSDPVFIWDDAEDEGLYEMVVHALSKEGEYKGYYVVFSNLDPLFEPVPFNGVTLTAVQEGNNVKLEAIPDGGSNVIYQFVYSEDQGETYKDVRGYDAYSNTSTYTWTGAEAGAEYCLAVHACEISKFPYSYYGDFAAYTHETVPATIFDEAGTYGPETDTETIEVDVIVTADGITLQNLVITGDLIIAEEVGDGDVTLNNLTVQGQLFVRGGGSDSIIINGGQYKNIVIQNVDGKVRIVAVGVIGEDGNPVDVVISEDASGEEIILEGEFDEVTVNAEGATVDLGSETVIQTMTLNSSTTITGDGTIKNANVNADGVSFEKEPDAVNVEEGVEEPAVGEPEPSPSPPSPGGGGGGGGSTPEPVVVSAISVSGDAVVGATLTATTVPSDADGNYQWQVSEDDGTTWENISGVTDETYKIDSVYAGDLIRVTFTASGSYTGTPTSTNQGPVKPAISTVDSIANGDVDPSITVTLDGDNFDQIDATVVGNWTFAAGGTTLDLKGVTFTGDTTVEGFFTGTAAAGILTIQANAGGLHGSVASDVLEVVVPAPDKEIESVETLADINVAYGTAIGGVEAELPATVEVTLDDTTTETLNVIWDGGTPAYDGDTAGTYLFEGTIELVSGIANTEGYTAEVNVIVEPNDDASLISVLGETDGSPAGGNGETMGAPITWEISVANEVDELAVGQIVAVTKAIANLYSDDAFDADEDDSISLAAGDATVAYIKVTAENSEILYYAVTITVLPGQAASIELTGPTSVLVGETSENFTIVVKDAQGNPTAVTENTTFTLVSDTNNGTATFNPVSPIQIDEGQGSATFTYSNSEADDNNVITAAFDAGDAGLYGQSDTHNVDVLAVTPLEQTVTFTEENELENVSIQVYSNEARTETVGAPVSTNDSGVATKELEDGNYWFTASLADYDDFEGSFVVSGEAKTVEFEMTEEQ